MLLSDQEIARLAIELLGTDRTIRKAAKKLDLLVPMSHEAEARARIAEHGVMQCSRCQWWRNEDVLCDHENESNVCEDCRCGI